MPFLRIHNAVAAGIVFVKKEVFESRALSSGMWFLCEPVDTPIILQEVFNEKFDPEVFVAPTAALAAAAGRPAGAPAAVNVDPPKSGEVPADVAPTARVAAQADRADPLDAAGCDNLKPMTPTPAVKTSPADAWVIDEGDWTEMDDFVQVFEPVKAGVKVRDLEEDVFCSSSEEEDGEGVEDCEIEDEQQEQQEQEKQGECRPVKLATIVEEDEDEEEDDDEDDEDDEEIAQPKHHRQSLFVSLSSIQEEDDETSDSDSDSTPDSDDASVELDEEDPTIGVCHWAYGQGDEICVPPPPTFEPVEPIPPFEPGTAINARAQVEVKEVSPRQRTWADIVKFGVGAGSDKESSSDGGEGDGDGYSNESIRSEEVVTVVSAEKKQKKAKKSVTWNEVTEVRHFGIDEGDITMWLEDEEGKMAPPATDEVKEHWLTDESIAGIAKWCQYRNWSWLKERACSWNEQNPFSWDGMVCWQIEVQRKAAEEAYDALDASWRAGHDEKLDGDQAVREENERKRETSGWRLRRREYMQWRSQQYIDTRRAACQAAYDAAGLCRSRLCWLGYGDIIPECRTEIDDDGKNEDGNEKENEGLGGGDDGA